VNGTVFAPHRPCTSTLNREFLHLAAIMPVADAASVGAGTAGFSNNAGRLASWQLAATRY